MGAKLEPTTTPGIFRRHAKGCSRRGRCGCAYVVTWRDASGSQRKRTEPTLAEAREARRLEARNVKLSKAHGAGLHREEPRNDCPECGRELTQREQAEPTVHEYAREWIERYQGTGRRGFREETRDGYRWNLERFALDYFPADLKLSQLDPRGIADFIGWLVKRPKQGGGTLSDSGVRNAFKPLSVCLGTARREGLIADNPATEAVLPHRPPADDDEQRARPFPRSEGVETMELVVSLIHPDHRLLFELLAATGVRRSELLGFEGRHLHLTGASPYVKVRQRVRRRTGVGLMVGPLKSKYARRDLPIPLDLADRLAALKAPDDRLVFRSRERGEVGGGPLDPDNLYDRVLSPACGEAGVEWAGFHTFRHTVASRLFAAGRNAVQVQRWLGHHSPSFTLDTYIHLLDADLGAPMEEVRGNEKATQRPKMAEDRRGGRLAEKAA